MSGILNTVMQFHKWTKQPIGSFGAPKMIAIDRAQLRLDLILEEVAEVKAAMELYYQGRKNHPDTLVSLANELADVVYVCYGLAVELGVDLDRAVEIVHDANMDKCWDDVEVDQMPDAWTATAIGGTDGWWAVTNEAGKIMKPPGHQTAAMEIRKVMGL